MRIIHHRLETAIPAGLTNRERLSGSIRINESVADRGVGYLHSRGGLVSVMDILELFRGSVEEFDLRVSAISDEQWNNATPCTDWNARDLVNHVTAEDLWAPPLLTGSTVEEVGDRFEGDVLGDNPVDAWDSARLGALAAATPEKLDGTVSTSRGEIPAGQYVFELFSDHLVHAWDLARAIGADEQLPPELVEACYEIAKPFQDMMKESGQYGETIETDPDASPQDQLLALFGRQP